MYVADLLQVLSFGWSVYCYTDNAQCYKSYRPQECNGLIGKLNINLNVISEWLKCNGLTMNSTKTQMMRLGLSSALLNSITINSNVIKVSSTVKNLGVFYDQNLGFHRRMTDRLSISWWKRKFKKYCVI